MYFMYICMWSLLLRKIRGRPVWLPSYLVTVNFLQMKLLRVFTVMNDYGIFYYFTLSLFHVVSSDSLHAI